MAHFVVYVIEKRKRKVVVDLQSTRLDIGARSTCALTVQDPVVADRHCQIDFEPALGIYTLRDRGTTTGTYLNGVRLAAAAPLNPGDSIVLGTLRLSVSIESEEDGPALHLELQEKAFQFQKAEYVRKTGDWIAGDRERWKESEVTFSRFPLLRKVSWGAAVVACLCPLLLFSSSVRERLFEPGPLSSVHAALFDGSHSLRPEHAALAAEGCQTCHDPFDGIPISNCYACHESTRASHPFQDMGDLAGHSTNSCLQCHVEHEGGAPTGSEQVTLSGPWAGHTVTIAKRTGSFVPTANAALCDECHEGRTFDEARIESLRVAAAAASPPAPPGRPMKVPYDGFSHASHMAAGVDCKSCHLPAAGGDAPRALTAREFEPMGFEGCMGCHGDPGSGIGERVPRIADTGWTQSPPTVAVDWHGASDDPSHCQACHAQAYSGEMRTVPRQEFRYLDAGGAPLARADDDPRLLFEYTIRSHTEQFEAALASLDTPPSHPDDNCANCHVDGNWIRAGEAREGRFYHGVHLTELFMTADATRLAQDAAGQERLADSSAACAECHRMVAESNTLAEPFYRAEQDSCATCHRTREGDEASVPALIEAAQRIEALEPTRRIPFPHDAHMNSGDESLAAGCYACHSFEPSEVAFRNPVVTRATVKDCTECHSADHANLAGGACSQCHLPGDPAFASPLEAASWSVTKEWPAATTFNHFSNGHLSAVEEGCAECHTEIASAATIRDVRMPTEDDQACRRCHIEERGRFHWR